VCPFNDLEFEADPNRNPVGMLRKDTSNWGILSCLSSRVVRPALCGAMEAVRRDQRDTLAEAKKSGDYGVQVVLRTDGGDVQRNGDDGASSVRTACGKSNVVDAISWVLGEAEP